jgi:hypothetical protein
MTRYIRKLQDGRYEYGFQTADGKHDPHGRTWSRDEADFRISTLNAPR